MIIGHSALYPRAGEILRNGELLRELFTTDRFISEESVLRGVRRQRKIKTRCVYYQRSSTANRTKRTLRTVRILVLCHDGSLLV